MLMSYPALFYYDREEGGYICHFPDFADSVTQGETIEEVMYMASEYLGVFIADLIEEGKDIPKYTSINKLSLHENFPFSNDEEMKRIYLNDNSFKSMVVSDVEDYLNNKELVKKTVNIPKWVNELGRKRKINFSQCLTQSIINNTIRT